MIHTLRIICNNIFIALKQIFEGDYSYRASALAFTTLLSIVPMITVFVYILTHFFIFTKLNDVAKNFVIMNFVPTSSSEIIPYLNQFTQQAEKLPILSIIFLFITTIMLIMTIDDSMYIIWQKETRKFNLLSYIIYLFIILFIPVFIIISGLISSFLSYLLKYIPGNVFISLVVPLFINTMILSILYYVTTNVKIKWRRALIGAFIAAFILEFAKVFFSIYVNQFSNYELIYGTLSSIPVLLIWLYIFWLIILYGAIVVKLNYETL